LCLDCEELHDQPFCPTCASEEFAYISRWIEAPERRATKRVPAAPVNMKRQIAVYGLLGVAVGGLARWWWKAKDRLEVSALRGLGELR